MIAANEERPEDWDEETPGRVFYDAKNSLIRVYYFIRDNSNHPTKISQEPTQRGL